jgi:pyruvate-ferredoxin/flavodoxin oxidoreductase
MTLPEKLGQPDADPAVVIARTEIAAGVAVLATTAVGPADLPVERCPGAREAIRAAAARARAGGRASALLGAESLLDALPALREAAAERAPLVVHAVERRAGPAAGRDEIAPALEVGAGVLVTWSAQDAADIVLSARRAAEDSETPFLHVHDGGPAAAPALIPDPEIAARFLGARAAAQPVGGPPARDDAAGVEEPRASQEVQRKRAERSFAARVPFALAGAMRQLGELTGRALAPIERCDTADAEEIVLAIGSAFPPAREVARSLREQGRRVGVIGLRALRPFFAPEIVKALGRASAVVVIEPFDVALSPCGPVAASVKAALADALTWAPGFPGIGRIPPVISTTFATIDGAIAERDIRLSLAELASGERARRVVVLGSDG